MNNITAKLYKSYWLDRANEIYNESRGIKMNGAIEKIANEYKEKFNLTDKQVEFLFVVVLNSEYGKGYIEKTFNEYESIIKDFF